MTVVEERSRSRQRPRSAATFSTSACCWTASSRRKSRFCSSRSSSPTSRCVDPIRSFKSMCLTAECSSSRRACRSRKRRARTKTSITRWKWCAADPFEFGLLLCVFCRGTLFSAAASCATTACERVCVAA